MKRLGLLLLLLCFCFSCAPTIREGRMIDRAKLNQIVPGKTDTKTLVAILGNPDNATKGQAGQEKYVYHFYQSVPTHWYKLDRVDRQRLEVTITNGVVEKYQILGTDLTGIAEK